MTELTLKTGLKLLGDKAFEKVHAGAIDLIKKRLDDPLPYFLLGVIASEHRNHGKALELFEQAATYEPRNICYIAHHAKQLSAMGRQNAAKTVADKAAKLQVDDAYIADTIGVVYSRAGYHKDAIPLFEKAVGFNPRQANFYYNLGASAQFIGDFKTAKTAYEKALNLDKSFYRAWSSLISLSKQTPDTNHYETLKSLFEAAVGDAEGQLQLGHAIAKTLEDLSRHEESLDWLLAGKKAKRSQLRYDRIVGQALLEAAKQTSATPSKPETNYAQDTPILIVGLPRTGTTLVDRILSSHPDVVSAGELNMFAELIKEETGTDSNLVMDTKTFQEAAHLDLARVGKSYIDNTKDRAGDSKYMIDKMPLNFFYAGLIHRALPNARIIALRRGAMDSCLSNFRQLFSTQYSYYNYTFDLEDTAWFYRQFDDLMSHWRATIPQDRFIEVRYEDIIFGQENQTRRLLDFCGLDWDDACMRFHENTAPVSTASSVQVRQPLYSGSIGRWKKYGDKLDGLKAALGNLAD
ncbi:tetratricopeptide repeat-containing sulfotransferase family protein [Robiginitomaculum antarcticum]|uniref:tetratricopeptide repeat-containing sulfotransferase family protein n=1 Tax=Robiginitomaculum antarcticum TaxID=437507 RepID=UPI000364B67D|nr:sulfotransferase [Robiginitomaculum antarcticum]